MATLRRHPLLYRATTPPIGQAADESPRPLTSHWFSRLSVWRAPALIPFRRLAIFRAKLLDSCVCQSRKQHNTIGSFHSVFYIAASEWLRRTIPHKQRDSRNRLLLLSYYITSTCALWRRGLVQGGATRAPRMNTKTPIGYFARSRATLKSLGPLPMSSLLIWTSAFLPLTRASPPPSFHTVTTIQKRQFRCKSRIIINETRQYVTRSAQ